MTTIYFVRHAQPEYEWVDDRTRPLTDNFNFKRICYEMK